MIKLENLNQEAKYYLDIITVQVSSKYAINISHHAKAIRDILDNFEGHLYECYNSNGRYDHGTLKHNATYLSKAATKLRETMTKSQFNKLTHREHAKPLCILVKEIQGMSGQQLLSHLVNNLKSVTILKQEAKALDGKYKTSMPDENNIFSRFEEMNIKIVKSNKIDSSNK